MSVMSLIDPRTIDELLNYRLLKLFAVSGAPVIRLLEGRYGIARREWRLIGLLAAHGPLSPSALADEAALDRPRTSRAIGSLAAKGLLRREPLPGDHRRARVALTPVGQALHDEVFPQIAEINRRVVAALDPAACAALDVALAQLTTAAQARNAEAVRDVRADRRAGGSRRIRKAG
jgi:DNA-binding MarR family transcriptional regulator